MGRATACVIFTAALLGSGCATLTSSDMQQLSLTTRDVDGKAIDNVPCTLRNDRGTWKAVAPGFVDIRRSAEDLIVECKKEGQPDGLLRAISRAAGGMFGNIIFGGGVGAIIDHSRGTGYNYPDELPVRMGSSVTADRRTQDALANPEAASGQPK